MYNEFGMASCLRLFIRRDFVYSLLLGWTSSSTLANW